MSILEEDSLGACSIESVKLSDTKEWALCMKDKGSRAATCWGLSGPAWGHGAAVLRPL